jgi:3-hydroxymyristoyl/3-hydroxydecanoyl-(acyl carrier protein) dehydratase
VRGFEARALPTQSNELAWRVRVAPDSPFFEGHFTDHPILPAVAELALVEELVREASASELAIRAIPSLRFRATVGPGDEIDVRLGAVRADGTRTLRLERAGVTVAQGSVALAREEADA